MTYKHILHALSKHKGEDHTPGEWLDIFLDDPKTPEHDLTPLEEFVKQLNFVSSITNTEVYLLYLEWCDDVPLEKNSFAKRLPKALKKHRPEIVRYRSGSVRGYRYGQ